MEDVEVMGSVRYNGEEEKLGCWEVEDGLRTFQGETKRWKRE